MSNKQRSSLPQWFNDQRQAPRWTDSRMALARLKEEECPAMTGDLSSGGMQLALVGVFPQIDEEIRVDVAFEEDVVEMSGRVAYSVPKPWGSLIGVNVADETIEGYLALRYSTNSVEYEH